MSKTLTEYSVQQLNDRILEISMAWHNDCAVRLVLYGDGSGHLELVNEQKTFFHFLNTWELFETGIGTMFTGEMEDFIFLAK